MSTIKLRNINKGTAAEISFGEPIPAGFVPENIKDYAHQLRASGRNPLAIAFDLEGNRDKEEEIKNALIEAFGNMITDEC